MNKINPSMGLDSDDMGMIDKERLLSDSNVKVSASDPFNSDGRPRRVSTMQKRRDSRKDSVRGRRNSNLSESILSELSNEEAARSNLRPHYRDIKLKEMMQYYTPKWMAVVGIFASIASAFQLPMFGYILSQYVFVLALPLTTDAERNEYNH